MKKSALFPIIFLLLLVVVLVLVFFVSVFRQGSDILAALLKIDAEKVSRSVVALSAIGLLTMALIQSARNLLPIRAWFHKRTIRKRLGYFAVDELHSRLQISKSEAAFYDLPIQSICGQIAAVAENVLTEEVHPEFLPKDQPSILLAALAGSDTSEDFATLAGLGEQKSISYSETRSRIGARIQRNIDNLQITVGTRWRRYLRIAAAGLSAVFSETLLIGTGFSGVVAIATTSWTIDLTALGAAIVGGMIAGYLASIFRDAVAVIERWRQS